MTLKEFVQNTLTENNMDGDCDAIIEMITDIARERAIEGSAAISSDEIMEMVINNVDLANKLKQEKEANEKKAEEEKAKRVEEKKQEKLKKQLEKERKTAIGEQVSLFGD